MFSSNVKHKSNIRLVYILANFTQIFFLLSNFKAINFYLKNGFKEIKKENNILTMQTELRNYNQEFQDLVTDLSEFSNMSIIINASEIKSVNAALNILANTALKFKVLRMKLEYTILTTKVQLIGNVSMVVLYH